MTRHGFTWGVAASAYQTEGAATVDGRGQSIWDSFHARTGDTGAIACDFYHRYPGDIALMHQLGIDAFRFSVSWPRVLPEGRGRVNGRGLDFYDRLVDALLECEIEPFVNLFHWDLPQALEDEGGWPVRATADAFAEYAAVVADRLGDRVTYWSTHNEPFCASWLGYGLGEHAPGRRDERAAFAAAHTVLLSHGLAASEIRRHARAAEVGIIVDSWPAHPASDDPRALAAAWAADGVRNRWFFDALLRGSYPRDVLERHAADAPMVRDGDLERIATRLDWLGVNNYSRTLHDEHGGIVRAPAAPLTAMHWEIYPDGLREVLCRLNDEYEPPPLYVAEFGAAFDDVRVHDGHIHDVDRIAFLKASIGAIDAAVAAGVDVRGAFVWSLLDNFEWAEGYSKRFGLVYVDYPTLERIPKSSFAWYRDLIATRKAAAAPRRDVVARAGLVGVETTPSSSRRDPYSERRQSAHSPMPLGAAHARLEGGRKE
jgi:beta-glucosidase